MVGLATSFSHACCCNISYPRWYHIYTLRYQQSLLKNPSLGLEKISFHQLWSCWRTWDCFLGDRSHRVCITLTSPSYPGVEWKKRTPTSQTFPRGSSKWYRLMVFHLWQNISNIYIYSSLLACMCDPLQVSWYICFLHMSTKAIPCLRNNSFPTSTGGKGADTSIVSAWLEDAMKEMELWLLIS